MNFGQMQDEVGFIVKDVSLRDWLPGWINDAILQIAADYDLPPLQLAEAEQFGVDGSKWLWQLPDSFHKNLFKVKWQDPSDGSWHHVHIHQHFAQLSEKDHSITGDNVHEVAVIPQGDIQYLGIHPLAANTLYLWYFRKPATLVEEADVCDCIPSNFLRRVVYPQVLILNYQFITDQIVGFNFKPLQYWEMELRKGLFGAPGQGIGLIPFFNRNNTPPRRHGGRDPIGWRPYRYGAF